MSGAIVDASAAAEAVSEVGAYFFYSVLLDAQFRVPSLEVRVDVGEICSERWVTET